MRRISVILLLVLTWAASDMVKAAEPQQDGCAGNRLANPGFDGGSHKTEGEGTSLSSAGGDGWSPWFVRGGESVNREPEFKVEQAAIGGDPYRIRSGGQSMKWFTTWATHDAGVYQRVAVSAGSQVTFWIHGMAYSGEDDGWNDEHRTFFSDSARPGNYRMAAGIDPTGALPSNVGAPPPATVIWSTATMTTDQWVRLAVSAVAQSNTVTVYARGWPEFSVKHNDSFWDDACVVAAGRAAAPTGDAKPAKPVRRQRPGYKPHLRTGRAIPE